MDKYAANWSVLLIAISECVLIAWIYGSQRFLNDIQGMIGKRSKFWNSFWSAMWRYITPATLLVSNGSMGRTKLASPLWHYAKAYEPNLEEC